MGEVSKESGEWGEDRAEQGLVVGVVAGEGFVDRFGGRFRREHFLCSVVVFFLVARREGRSSERRR